MRKVLTTTVSRPNPETISRNPWGLSILTVLVLTLSSCASLVPSPTPTPTSPPTATVTPTIVWFPPTSTRTPLPSPVVQATQEPLPGIGEEIFTDAFDQPELWNTAVSPVAAVIVADDQLTLSVNSEISPTLLVSLRSEPLVQNFYIEVTASLNLCRGNDRYGVIFRANGSGSYFRYVLNCTGQTRFEKVVAGQASAPRDWLTSPLAPAGAPGEVRIGVWAAGSELRFYLNGRYQYTIEDATFLSGTVGLFVSSYTATPTSISFSEMTVYTVNYKRPTPTRLPPANP